MAVVGYPRKGVALKDTSWYAAATIAAAMVPSFAPDPFPSPHCPFNVLFAATALRWFGLLLGDPSPATCQFGPWAASLFSGTFFYL